MDSRERTFRTLAFEEPDRVPIDFWATSGFRRKLESALNISYRDFLDANDDDLRYIPGPSDIGPPLRRFSAGSQEDIWGVRRKAVTLRVGDAIEAYREVAECPLASATTLEEIESYDHWPSPDWFDYGEIEAQCEEIRKRRRVVVFMGDRLNRIAQLKPAMYVRGVEQILMDIIVNPEIAEAVFGRIADFYAEYARYTFEAAEGDIDIFFTGDDIGNSGPMAEEVTISRAFREVGPVNNLTGKGFMAFPYARVEDSNSQTGTIKGRNICLSELVVNVVEIQSDGLGRYQIGIGHRYPLATAYLLHFLDLDTGDAGQHCRLFRV